MKTTVNLKKRGLVSFFFVVAFSLPSESAVSFCPGNGEHCASTLVCVPLPPSFIVECFPVNFSKEKGKPGIEF
jgi:hypothetical protein